MTQLIDARRFRQTKRGRPILFWCEITHRILFDPPDCPKCGFRHGSRVGHLCGV